MRAKSSKQRCPALCLYQAIEQYENWFEFFVEAYFCLGVFWPDWSWNQLKTFRSGVGA